MSYVCCDLERRAQVAGSATNGIDFLEVLDRDAPPGMRQRILRVHFVNDPAPALDETSVRITGGERVRDIRVTDAVVDAADSSVLAVTVDQPGDFSVYTLSLVQDESSTLPPPGVDPALASVDFSFKVECPSDFDCLPRCLCPAPLDERPEIDYLAKDFASFRRLMLDRLAVLAPGWRERSPADLGMALIELFAFAGDYLSYQQDAVATEAYLRTARRRVSVRRHAMLVDYDMHDGCNARAWVQFVVDSDVVGPAAVPRGTPLCTALLGQGTRLADPALLTRADAVFETMTEVPALFVDHNRIPFYTWGDDACCLRVGATSATLAGHFPNLTARDCDAQPPIPGDVLIFEEVRGPLTGIEADADPDHRWAVRLTNVRAFAPPVPPQTTPTPLTDPVTGTEITEITWDDADALPFPLCVSSRADEEHGGGLLDDVSVACGNIVLADHGLTLPPEDLGAVPVPRIFLPDPQGACERERPAAVPPRYRPALSLGPVTQAVGLACGTPASRASASNPAAALPTIALVGDLAGDLSDWTPALDLLNSDGDALRFVAEIEQDGTATLRFGDSQHGRRPESGTTFQAVYRVGNGAPGNVGREAISHIFDGDPAIVEVRNALPAAGGIDPESMEDVRQRAPSAFRTQQRAVTESDYAEIGQRYPGIQRAAATFRWTGSWHTVFLTVDRLNGRIVDTDFERDVIAFVERFRMAGHDLDVDGPRFVPLQIEMLVCVAPNYFRSDVRAALLEIFSNRVLPDGRRGLFHPDNFTFGQTVYLSPLIAAAQEVPGVSSVEIIGFRRQGTADPKPLQDGQLPLGRLEIARLDNDPSFPERGLFTLTAVGGK